MSSNKDCPCYRHNKDCDFRKKDCHATCQEYKDWRAVKDNEKKAKTYNEAEYLSYITKKIVERRKRKNEKNSI